MSQTASDTEIITPVSSTETDPLTTDSLKQLQSKDERRLLDVVDKLRRTGLDGTIELPQLVVCGDQSSGKSSVLEAITEIPFPRKAGLCTRFATEIVLRRQPTNSVTIKINPSKHRTPAEQKKLSVFSKTITDFSELPDVIEDATGEMGLAKIGESAAFSRDILSVEICGPDRPQLTLVDLPGLIHSATKASTDADKELIFGLVQEYMRNPRTIILAVVSAKNDAANQIILTLIKEMDKNGSRTLGIITKPDHIQGAGDQQFWFDLALNKEVFLKRGWHMIKNRSEEQMQFTFQERNEAERVFFNKDKFKDLPRHNVGIEALRVRLSNLLLRHLTQELPSLKEGMKDKLSATEDSLAALGKKRETPQEQRMLLTSISTETYQILSAAMDGHYSHDFFKSVDLNKHIAGGKSARRLRAVIQDLNQVFADNMRLRGHKYEIAKLNGSDPAETQDDLTYNFNGLLVSEDEELEENVEEEIKGSGEESMEENEEEEEEEEGGVDFDEWLPKPKKMTQEEAMKWVKIMVRGCRGHELPSSVNPEVTSHLFWEQSEPWKEIAEAHIDQVRSACKEFAHQVLEYAAPIEFQKPLEDIVVNAVLEDALKDGKKELQKLLEDKTRPPSTYNHCYSDTVQKRRQDKYMAALVKAHETASREHILQGVKCSILDRGTFHEEIAKAVKLHSETFAAEEALESLLAIYEDKSKYFVTAVTDQVIERCMIQPLPSKLLSPTVVQCMTDEDVAFIAAEPPETVAQRAFLEERKQMLEKGFEIFREAIGGVMRGNNGR